jgi:spectinomycin phosphotransferase
MEHQGREIATLVEQAWKLRVRTVERLTGGLDPDAATYDVVAEQNRYFVKVRRTPADVTVPRYLEDQGITAVVAPLEELMEDGVQVLLYPFVDGTDCWIPGLTDDQYVEYGRILAAIHAAKAPDNVPEETFDPHSIPLLGTRTGQLLELLRPHARHLDLLIERAEALRADVAATPPRDRVLCHGDIHSGNMLSTKDGQLSIVDWDAPILAPRERDLVFVLEGPWGDQPATEHQKALFYKGYGRYDVHRPTLDYYYVERIVDDIGQFALSVLDPAASNETKRTALHWLERNLRDALPYPA